MPRRLQRVIEANGEMTKYRERVVIEREEKKMVSLLPGLFLFLEICVSFI